MLSLLRVLLGDTRRRPGSALASIVSIAIGVGVFVAIHLSGTGARESFVSAVEALSGRATHELSADSGVKPDRLRDLIDQPAVQAAQPIVEGMVSVLEIRRAGRTLETKPPPLRVFGMDPFLAPPFLAASADEPLIAAREFTRFLTEPGAAIFPEPWARDAELAVGDEVVVAVAGLRKTLSVLEIYRLDFLGEAARETVIVDLATAQETLGRTSGLDRIELQLDESRVDEIRALLEPGERLERPSRRGERVARMVDAFRLNLLALGSLALVVGAILVFNAAQFSVVRRYPLLSKLRAIGASRRALVRAVLLELALLGAVGGVLGVALGQLIALALVVPIGQTIRELYAFVRVDVAELDVWFAVAAVSGATVIAVLAGFLAALDAGRAPARLVAQASRSEDRALARLPALASIATVAGLVGGGILLLPGPWWYGLGAALAFLTAGACLVPCLLSLLLPRIARLGERLGALSLALAAGALARSLTRTGGAAAALAVALSMSLGVIVMVSSFDGEVRRWIGGTLNADVFVGDAAENLTGDRARIPEQVVETLRSLAGVRAVDSLRGIELPHADRSFFFCGLEMSLEESWDRIEILEGDPGTAREGYERGEIFVSEPLATRYSLEVGDTFEISVRTGTTPMRVAAVFRDFSFDRGYAFTNSRRFTELVGERGVRNLALFLEDPGRALEFARSLRARFAGEHFLKIRSNAELRANVMDVFDRTFAVTYVLQAIATGMALCGIAVTLLALFLERAREIATLRAIGASARWVLRVFALESVLLAALPLLVALPLGALLASVLIRFVNLRAFGWTIRFAWPWSEILTTSLLAIGAGLVATALPLAFLRRQSLARSMREE